MVDEQTFEQKVDNDLVVLSDPLSQEIVQSQIESTKRELSDFERAREDKEKAKARYIEQAKVHQRARQIVLEGFSKKPEAIEWAYEENPEYWTIQKQMAAWKFEAEDKVDESTIKRFDYDLATIDEQIKNCNIKLTRLMSKE